ncbi:xanthine dehydrogenase family protein molybdopterin-binding subunit [Lichenibacterium dinghuense]|uniref:xanthine dehydrogenase family protein molybdopterin-binding subunit n=1 Tax=Lichenibacterium dinghuense TaxID=2895977 RepID=UPI001F330BA2|nr:xanthine dehydrogenase family protein molybdopterin-binding subunit [Lichenibacterium sp. 6Y81]
MSTSQKLVGTAQRRVDGRLKVTGGARYAAEFAAADLLHGAVVSGAIAKGRITKIDASAAEAVPGVVKIYTHQNRPRTAWLDSSYRDEVAPPGHPFRALHSDKIMFSGQPVALVLARDFETATYAASLVEVSYDAEAPRTDLDAERGESYDPPKKRAGIDPPPKPRGHADEAFASAPVQVRQEYRVAVEHHNPMEPHATTVVWEGGGNITVHDKIQGVTNTQSYVTGVFGLSKEQVRCISPFVGGGFGSGLRPQYQLFLAVLAALDLERSVRVVLTRDQMFTFGHRPLAIQTVSLGAEADGKLTAIMHDAVQETSTFEDYQENTVNWSGLLYDCANTRFSYELAKLDTYTPSDMRAPGAVLGVYALEAAMDELAYATGVDPVELRLRNYVADRDQNTNKKLTSKALRDCYLQGAERFGWSKRDARPRSMTDGRELVGWGMATGVWEAMMQKTSARATLTGDGRLEVATASADIGTGTYTILTQLAAEALGLRMEDVTAKLGDTSLPYSPLEGGSWTAASAGSAVQMACETVREKVFKLARQLDGSPLANQDLDHVTFRDGRIVVTNDPSRSVSLVDAIASSNEGKVEAEETAAPSMIQQMRFAAYTHSACFVEVKVDEELGVVRVTRVVSAVAAGRILNLQTARSQILGGVVMGIGSALHEEAMLDHTLGRFMNHNLGEYHVPVNADIGAIDVIFVDEPDDKASPIGVKGLGEIGIVGTGAAVANAIYHATGKRVRDLPITIDKLLDA